MPQTVDELKDRVTITAEIFNTILNDNNAWTHLGDQKRQQLITGVNKAFGQAMAFQHEYLTTRNQEHKARTVTTQTYADVTSGQADALYAKSTECKSVTKPEKGAVNKIIGDAIEQLGGQTGHTPRDGDVRIVDVVISGINNPWPMAGGSYGVDRAAVALSTLTQNASAELLSIINSGKPGARAVLQWLAGQTYTNPQQLGRLRDVYEDGPPSIYGQQPQRILKNPNSSRPVYQDTSGQIHKIRCLTIKIRYNPTYDLTDPPPPNHIHGLAEMLFQGFQNHLGQLTIQLVKTKRLTLDISQPNQIVVPVRTFV